MPMLLQRRELISGQRPGSGAIALSTGGGLAFAFTFNGEPFTFGGQPFTYGAP